MRFITCHKMKRDDTYYGVAPLYLSWYQLAWALQPFILIDMLSLFMSGYLRRLTIGNAIFLLTS